MHGARTSPVVWAFKEELCCHRRLVVKTLVASVVDAIVMFGFSPYLIALYAEQITQKSPDSDVLLRVTWGVALIVALHAAGFFFRVKWRRELTARGREGFSRSLRQAITEANADSGQAGQKLQGSSQKLQDIWVEHIFNITEVFLPFTFGTLSLLVFMVIQAPVVSLPIILVIAVGIGMAMVSARLFIKESHTLRSVEERERTAFDAMFAVASMKWLVDRLAPAQKVVSGQYTQAFRTQARSNARWQSGLLGLGLLLKIGAVAIGPVLVSGGTVSANTAILLVLLGSMVGERFTTITSMICSTSNALARGHSAAQFIQAVADQPNRPALSDVCPMEYALESVVATYPDGTEIVLPDLEFGPGLIVVMGDSGVGKSSFLKVITRTIGYKGKVRVAGRELRETDISARLANGSQAFGDVDMPVGHLFGDRICDKELKLALSCAGYPGIDFSKKLANLSGGQQRRAVLAAVIYEALTRLQDGLLVIDEPTNDLGQVHIQQVIRGINAVKETCPGLTIVLTTHEPTFGEIADQLATFQPGGEVRMMRRINGRLAAV